MVGGLGDIINIIGSLRPVPRVISWVLLVRVWSGPTSRVNRRSRGSVCHPCRVVAGHCVWSRRCPVAEVSLTILGSSTAHTRSIKWLLCTEGVRRFVVTRGQVGLTRLLHQEARSWWFLLILDGQDWQISGRCGWKCSWIVLALVYEAKTGPTCVKSW